MKIHSSRNKFRDKGTSYTWDKKKGNIYIQNTRFTVPYLVQPLLRNKYTVFTMGGTVALRSPSQLSMTGELLTCSQVQIKSVTLHIPMPYLKRRDQ